jgi:hypothetical protein
MVFVASDFVVFFKKETKIELEKSEEEFICWLLLRFYGLFFCGDGFTV